MNKNRAFTLVEVMIALAILSIAMVAGLVTTNSVLERTVYVEKKMLAHWVAINTINKLQLKLLKEELDVISTQGEESLRGINFNWNLTIDKQMFYDQELLNIKVDVSEKKNESSETLDSVSRMVPIL